MWKRATTTAICILLLLMVNDASSKAASPRTKRRVHLPYFGLGPYCTGCPPHFCDDDPAIVLGYCCGCAAFYDSLPVVCPSFLNCPLNGKQLCQDYEYMLHCCCESPT
ncbi:PREDICTED: uncharacterized protein LOC108556808 [Nicrophorus vespilloides]|uniref:Uncharacterized protein LOC108556808 n=1 Tax=Nicrophorus vespilloides TaxID=110193 RepID=A0ABM1M1X0_NICVS|nr:PREDICTED: uncharacterized protein LOC108556808 [Nicrophorus vespilloides]